MATGRAGSPLPLPNSSLLNSSLPNSSLPNSFLPTKTSPEPALPAASGRTPLAGAVPPRAPTPAAASLDPVGSGAARRPPSSLQRLDRNHTILHSNPPASMDDASTFVASMDGDDGGDEDEAQSAFIGKLIDDRYLVISLVGRGGMGSVYRAEQVHLRKTMAIKVLHENLVSKKQLISRFTREARAISRLSSPHTVMVYDFGRWGDVFYLVMELLEGEALDAALDREGPLPADRVVRIALQMCDSLSEAHKHGIVHRDLKPENVMLLRNAAHPDFVKILDFGLAKVQGVDDPYTIHSQRDIFGTPYYMSPEQIRATAEVDHRADIYAVGALMFRMLTQQHVFGAERNTFDILKAHLMEPPPKMAAVAPAAKVPEALEQIVARALEKDPKRRFQSMGELAEALVAAQKSNFTDAGLAPLPGTPAKSADAASKPAEAAVVAAAAPAAVPTFVREADTLESREADEALQAKERRGQRLRAVGFFAAIALGLGALAFAMSIDVDGAGGQEREPNDEPAHANGLGPDHLVAGVVGKRQSERQSDRDCFRLPPVTATDELTVRVTGVPNMDLALSFHGPDGDARTTQSHRGRGQGELLRYLDTRTPLAVVCVNEFIADGAVAGESLSDAYQLQVLVAPRPANAEREPNDQGQGNELTAGASLVGSLDGGGDRDLFALQGNVDNRVVRIGLDLQQASGTPIRMALLDSSHRMLGSVLVRAGELRGLLAFVASGRQLPDRVFLQRVTPSGGVAPAEEIGYTVSFDHTELGDQAEVEPNNTEASATPTVLGAWHVGHADDAAGVDWLRVDGGDQSMRRIRIEAIAPPGSSFWLVVRDQGTQVDLRKLLVQGGAQEQQLLVTGSGEGFLLRIQQIAPPSARRGKGPESRYQLRARFVSGEEEADQGLGL